ncbi:MAG: beta-CASP ribonuclease aCPSF1, partial [Thermoplasmata archaeon]
KEATQHLRELIDRTLQKKGKILIPVFAVGRSQEVMIVIEELMRNGDIPEVPVYLDGMIWEATAIHTAYPEYLNNRLRTQTFQKGKNPLLSEIFVKVDGIDMRERIINDPDPCVVLATSGMMMGGPIIEYFKAWAGDEKNMLIFVGYQAEGSLGRKIQKGWREVSLGSGSNTVNVKINMDVETVDGFSGHSDRRQLMNYISNMSPRPERIVFLHGEESKCLDLSSSVHRRFNFNTVAPKNMETIRFV